MKTNYYRFFSLITLAAMTLVASAQQFKALPDGMYVSTPEGEVTLTTYTPHTVRVVKTPKGSDWDKQSLAVVAKPQNVRKTVKGAANKAIMTTDALVASVDMTTGVVTIADKKGKILLSEKGPARFTPISDAGIPAFQAAQTFAAEPSEALYGLGILQNGQLSQRGVTKRLMPDNTEDGIPYVHSSKNYSVFWDNYSPTQFSDNSEGFTFNSEVADGVDYYFLSGNNADQVVAQMRSLTGRVPMMPLWAYGFMQSKERYKSQAELLDVLRTYRKQGIPIDCMIQDWQYWGPNYLWNAMEFLNPEFDRAQDMIDEVHRSGAHLMISIWSSFGPHTKQYGELAPKGLLFDFATWPQSGISHVWPPRMDYPSGVKVYDAYSPEARDIYWKYLRNLHNMGIDAWWMDSTEPDHLDRKDSDYDTPTHLGSLRKVRGAYPLMAVGGVHDHQLADSAQKRVCILTRSGFAGQQRYGCNVWSGDVSSTWQNLRKQLTAGLNFTLTGNPNFNSDLGGFFAGAYNWNWKGRSGTQNPAFRELYVRWTQMGVFTPMMRSHGADVPREIYLYGTEGEPVYDALVAAVKQRYALMPYIYSTAHDVSAHDGSFMRALFMDFPSDSAAAASKSQYMFGRQLLVAPVLHAFYTPEDYDRTDDSKAAPIDFTRTGSQSVYLPAGTDWYDFHSGTRHTGGHAVDVSTTLANIPVFVRAGSILPLGPDVQYTGQKPWDNLLIKLYPGADGAFTLYEDDGHTNAYQQGQYTEIPMKWNDRSRTLLIGARQGSFPTMIPSRTFTLTLPDGTTHTVTYSGKAVKVKF